jgi:hypothetical protein
VPGVVNDASHLLWVSPRRDAISTRVVPFRLVSPLLSGFAMPVPGLGAAGFVGHEWEMDWCPRSASVRDVVNEANHFLRVSPSPDPGLVPF